MAQDSAAWRTSLAEAQAAPVPPGPRSALLLARGSMKLRYYAPRGADSQTPHDQDELYVVAQGTGWLRRGDDRVRFAPLDVLFVPAGMAHRFEEFSEDFAAWVVFYGPLGGERT